MNHNPDAFYNNSCNDVPFDDYLLLGGGTDINPAIYGEEDHGYCQRPNKRRDYDNISAIADYVAEGKPIFGICRGFQLLDAVFGGKLIQHTVGHPNGVDIYVGDDEHGADNLIPKNRNCHHQVVNSHYTNGRVLGWAQYDYNAYMGNDVIEQRHMVPEIIFWPEKKALAVQFHPEWQGANHKMNIYLRGLIKELLGLENVL